MAVDNKLLLIGSLASSHVYTTFGYIGVVADNVQKDLYKPEQVEALMQEVTLISDPLVTQLEALRQSDLTPDDAKAVTEIIDIYGLLKQEAEALRLDSTRTAREQIEAIRLRRPEPAKAREAYAAEAERARRFVAERELAPIADGRLDVVTTPSYARAFSRTLVYVPPAVFEAETSGLLCLYAMIGERTDIREDQQQQGRSSDK